VSPQDSTDRRSLISRIDIYTVLLGLAFLALCIACLLLVMELGRYNWKVQPPNDMRATELRSTPSLARGACLLAVGDSQRMEIKDVV
jgi:hypothetical protein